MVHRERPVIALMAGSLSMVCGMFVPRWVLLNVEYWQPVGRVAKGFKREPKAVAKTDPRGGR